VVEVGVVVQQRGPRPDDRYSDEAIGHLSHRDAVATGRAIEAGSLLVVAEGVESEQRELVQLVAQLGGLGRVAGTGEHLHEHHFGDGQLDIRVEAQPDDGEIHGRTGLTEELDQRRGV